jgi:hypothetical protein
MGIQQVRKLFVVLAAAITVVTLQAVISKLASGQILHATGPMPSFEVTTIKPVKSGGMEPGFRSGGPEAPGSVVHSYNVTYER